MKKLIKIWGVALTVVLVGSMFAIAPAPVSAAPGGGTFTAQNLPSAAGDVLQNGSDVTDMAIANDGSTVYVVDANVNCNAANAIRVSTNGGNSFGNVAGIPAGAGANPPLAIAVAPDDPNAVAIIEAVPGAAPDLVHISSNGGTTWSTLPNFLAASINADALDVAVGPARSGTLLGREYAVALADPTAANTDSAGMNGDVMIIGTTTAWRSAGRNTVISGDADYVAVQFDPNFVGTRVLVAVAASSADGAATIANGIYLHLLNDATGLQVLAPTAVYTALACEYQAAVAAGTDVVKGDLALPSDYDPTTGSGRRAYVAIATAGAAIDDIFRVDNATFRALGATNRGYHSVSYTGTIDEGTLFLGDRIASTVRFSTNAQVSLPTWTSTKKAPTGATNTVVRVPNNFSETSKVFAGTTGAESAFSVSNNAGVSFDQESIIDNGVANTVVAIQSIAITPDGGTIFMATDDATELSLWKSSTPVSAVSWKRVRNMVGTAGLVKVNPGWADAPAVYFANVAAAGAIHRSGNGGDIFATRAAPAGVTLVDLAVEDANTIYLARTATSNVYKSTTGAWTWGLPKTSGTGNIVSMTSAGADHLLVGKVAAFSYSTDGGGSYTRVAANAAENYLMIPDGDYANNNTIYVADSSAAITTGGVYRFVIGTDSVVTALTNTNVGTAAPNQVVGLTMNNGALYVQTTGAVGATAAAPNSGCDRNLNPRTAAATVAATWDTMNRGLNWAAAAAPAFTVPAANTPFSMVAVAGDTNQYYVHDGVVTLRAYNDVFATTKPVLTNPGDGATVGIDPVTGRAELVTLTFDPVGTGTSAGNRADMRIRVKGDSWAAAANNANQAVNSAAPSVTMASAGATWIYAMRANTEYEWQVRFDTATSGDVVRTPWSDPFTIKVQSGTVVQQPHAGPVVLGPVGAAAANTSLTPGVAWAPYAGATKYQVILSTDAAGANRVAGTPVFVDSPAFQPSAPLEYGMTYFAFITAVEPTVSPQSVISFTTMAKPTTAPKPAPPVVVKEQAPMPAPVINIPAAPAPVVTQPIIWTIIIIGAILIIVVIVLIIRTRRPM